MPSTSHEAFIQMFRRNPALAAQLLTEPFGLELPDGVEAGIGSGELTPVEFRADLVIVLSVAGSPVLAVVLEVQLSRDPGKRRSWPVYLATLRARLDCPVVVLVVCADAAVAAWCAVPIELGPGSVVTPLVVGPDGGGRRQPDRSRQVPVVTDPGVAGQSPELAVLSVLAHAGHPELGKILLAMLAAFRDVDAEHTTLYHDVLFALLPEPARRQLEALMAVTYPYEYQSAFVRKYVHQGRAEGRAEGEASAVLAVLETRGIAVPNEARARITGCTDADQLDLWIRRAVTARTVQDLFD